MFLVSPWGAPAPRAPPKSVILGAAAPTPRGVWVRKPPKIAYSGGSGGRECPKENRTSLFLTPSRAHEHRRSNLCRPPRTRPEGGREGERKKRTKNTNKANKQTNKQTNKRRVTTRSDAEPSRGSLHLKVVLGIETPLGPVSLKSETKRVGFTVGLVLPARPAILAGCGGSAGQAGFIHA